MNFNNLITLMEGRKIATKSDLVGVSEQEINALESFFDLQFPKKYREYLATFGRSAGHLSTWMAIYFDDLKEIVEEFEFQKACRGLVFNMPESALLISNMGTAFDYIICDDTDDPTVYRIDLKDSGKPSGELYTQTFTDYLLRLINCANDNSNLAQFYVDISGNMCDGEFSKKEDLGEDLLVK